MKPAFGAAATWIISALVGVAYVGLVAYGSRYPDLPLDDPEVVR